MGNFLVWVPAFKGLKKSAKKSLEIELVSRFHLLRNIYPSHKNISSSQHLKSFSCHPSHSLFEKPSPVKLLGPPHTHPVFALMELVLAGQLMAGNISSLPGRHERLELGLVAVRHGQGLYGIQIKKLQAARFQINILMLHVILQKSKVLPLISGVQARRTRASATQRTSCTTLAAHTDLDITTRYTDTCLQTPASGSLRFTFWDISGSIRPLQSSKGMLRSLVFVKSRACLWHDLFFPPTWLILGCTPQAHSHLRDEQDNSHHFNSLWNEFLMATLN